MKKIILISLVLILLIGTAACSAKATHSTVAPATTTAYNQGKDSSGVSPTFAPPVPSITVTTAPAPTPASLTGGKGSEYYASTQTATIDRMVISTAQLTLVVDDISTALGQITALASANGGYVVNSEKHEDQNRLYASISFRVDSTKFNSVLTSLHGLAVDVKSESTSGQDVTSQYVDLSSQLRNLEASETQLLQLMAQTGTVSDILEVERELTNTRGQIEQIKGQMQYLQQSSDLAMIYVSLEQSKLSIEFSADTRTIKAGASVQFTPSVAGGFSPYSYVWDFGDGTTSTEPSPAHKYTKGGTFTVSVKVTDDKSNTDEATRADYINVQPGWSGGSVATGAWNALVGFGHFLGAFFIGLGIFSPVWIAILVILYFAWWRRRKKPVK